MKKMGYNKSGAKGKRAMKWVCEYMHTAFPWVDFTRNLKVQSGDIFTAHNFPFVIEVKNCEQWRFSHFFNDTSLQSAILSYWKQVLRDRKLVKKDGWLYKVPLLIFTRNRELYYFMMPGKTQIEWRGVGVKSNLHKKIVLAKNFSQCLDSNHLAYLKLPANKVVVFPAPSPEIFRRIVGPV